MVRKILKLRINGRRLSLLTGVQKGPRKVPSLASIVETVALRLTLVGVEASPGRPSPFLSELVVSIHLFQEFPPVQYGGPNTPEGKSDGLARLTIYPRILKNERRARCEMELHVR